MPVELPQLNIPNSEKVGLRVFDMGDLDLIREASRDQLIPHITSVPKVFSDEEGEAFIQRQNGRRSSGVGYSLVIDNLAEGVPAGQVGLWPDGVSGRATMGYWVVKSQRGKRLAAEALNLLAVAGLGTLGLHRLTLYIEPWNVASIKTAELAGFINEATLKRWEVVDGEAKDMAVFSRLV